MLEHFEDNLNHLSHIEIHPSLQMAINTNTSNGKVIDVRNLLDTIPIARERAWVEKCAQAHQKVNYDTFIFDVY
jgi:hypothetical protein